MTDLIGAAIYAVTVTGALALLICGPPHRRPTTPPLTTQPPHTGWACADCTTHSALHVHRNPNPATTLIDGTAYCPEHAGPAYRDAQAARTARR